MKRAPSPQPSPPEAMPHLYLLPTLGGEGAFVRTASTGGVSDTKRGRVEPRGLTLRQRSVLNETVSRSNRSRSRCRNADGALVRCVRDSRGRFVAARDPSSTPHLAQFLHELSERAGAERIRLFVHSMGHRGLLNALERIRVLGHSDLQLGQVFFCAPDEDVRTFRDKTSTFPHRFESRTLLVSPEDKAVAASRWLHDQDRVGLVPPVLTFDKIETIEVGGFGILGLGHGYFVYFVEAEPVIRDMREAITTRNSAAEREVPQPFENHFVIDVREAT